MTPLLEVQHLAYAFDAEREPLADVSFAVAHGERVGIVGANGAGKTTLLWCLLGLLEGRGTIRIDGATPGAAAAMTIGVVFQNPDDQLFMPHLVDDLALPLINRGLPAANARARRSRRSARWA